MAIYYDRDYIPTPAPTPPPEIPTPSVNDNGKFLGVSDGEYSIESLPVQENERCVLKHIYDYDLEKNIYDIIEYPTSVVTQNRESLINAIASGNVDIFVNDSGVDSYKVNIVSYSKTLSNENGISFYGIISGYDALIPSELHLFSGSLGLTVANDEFYPTYDDIFNI